ncbi:hypothetical protein HG263_04775 [Pseudoalteromonas sp. JBTF-M23]|uniref:Uncharacterized protein n=1 Tax=Pseudoalteromonas caenipelagi TaxID=2726988 RepID=A0A849VAF8_9GAMM|nr:hypothetical protein [Pseudoalteromonas caenipelagi]NOU49848.1 hypothetical protein [Pseudoalteromonas caenipelagi]
MTNIYISMLTVICCLISSKLHANTSPVMQDAIDNIERVTPIPEQRYHSAFQAIRAGDFEQWLTQQHSNNKLAGFELIDERFATLIATQKITAEHDGVTITLDDHPITTATGFPVSVSQTFKFADNTSATAVLKINVKGTDNKASLGFDNIVFYDKLGRFIPASKHILTRYIKRASSLESLGNTDAVLEHISAVFNGRVEYISYLNKNSTTPTQCDFNQEHKLYSVTCK